MLVNIFTDIDKAGKAGIEEGLAAGAKTLMGLIPYSIAAMKKVVANKMELFGMGKDPRKDPCHERFYQTLEKWSAEFLKQETAKELLQRASVWWGKEAVMLYISWDILPIMCCMPLPSGTVER